MRTPLSSCRKYLVLARGDGDRCLEGSVATRGTSVSIPGVPSRLVCDPVRGRRDDEGEMNAGDEICGRSGIKGGPLLDVFAASEG